VEIGHYLAASGEDLYQLWFDKKRPSNIGVIISGGKMNRKAKSAASRGHEEATVESFRKDPAFAAEYLNSVLEDGDQKELMLALRRMSKAFGGVQKLAEEAELNANTLYRTLSPEGNPELKSLKALLRAMGMQLTVRPLRKRVT
jgi:probable addiction module antidote protein